MGTISGLEVVAESSDIAGALGFARVHASEYVPDALLVSASVWAVTDEESASTFRRELPHTCVLVIGGDGSDGVELGGGCCWLPRDAGIREFCAAVSSMLGGRCADCGFQRNCEARRAVAALSPRERQVAVRVAAGLTSKQIASMLGVAIRTVNTYRESLARKIGASSAAVLTRYVIESGLRDTGFVDGEGS